MNSGLTCGVQPIPGGYSTLMTVSANALWPTSSAWEMLRPCNDCRPRQANLILPFIWQMPGRFIRSCWVQPVTWWARNLPNRGNGIIIIFAYILNDWPAEQLAFRSQRKCTIRSSVGTLLFITINKSTSRPWCRYYQLPILGRLFHSKHNALYFLPCSYTFKCFSMIFLSSVCIHCCT